MIVVFFNIRLCILTFYQLNFVLPRPPFRLCLPLPSTRGFKPVTCSASKAANLDAALVMSRVFPCSSAFRSSSLANTNLLFCVLLILLASSSIDFSTHFMHLALSFLANWFLLNNSTGNSSLHEEHFVFF